MRMVTGGEGSRSDLTGRARIRGAALELFAAHGYAGTTIRGVAERAGVSPGLVQHHFGSKAGLREACDDQVVETLGELVRQGMERGRVEAGVLAMLYEASEGVVRYLARALVDGSPGAERLFDETAAIAERWLSESWPERYPAGSQRVRERAGAMAAMRLGPLVLHVHAARWMGVDPVDPGNLHRLGAAIFDVFDSMSDYLASEQGTSLREALAEYERGRGREEGDDA